MLEAAFWGLVGGLALLVGAVLALARRVSPRVIGTVMAFGACVLISAVAFELVEEAFESAGAVPVMLGMVVGSLVFYAGDWVLDHRGGRNRKRSGRRRGRPGRSRSARCWTASRSPPPSVSLAALRRQRRGWPSSLRSSCPTFPNAAGDDRGSAVLRRRRDPHDARRHDDAGELRERGWRRRAGDLGRLRVRVPDQPCLNPPPPYPREGIGSALPLTSGSTVVGRTG